MYHYPGVDAAIFPNEPERTIYNNVILAPGLPASARAIALDAMAEEYAAAGIAHFAAWVHESDPAMCRDLERRGYRLNETTRAMGMALDGLRPPRPEIDHYSPGWSRYLHLFELPLYAVSLYASVMHWGIIGAAAMWTLRAFLDCLLMLQLVGRESARPVGVPLLVGMAVIALAGGLSGAEWSVQWRAGFGVVVVATAVAIAWLGLLNEDDRKEALKLRLVNKSLSEN